MNPRSLRNGLALLTVLGAFAARAADDAPRATEVVRDVADDASPQAQAEDSSTAPLESPGAVRVDNQSRVDEPLSTSSKALPEAEPQPGGSQTASAPSLPGGGEKSGVTSQAISLPKGAGTVKGMEESFSMQLSTGVATYSIPFGLPAARGAAQPALGLSYSSASGSGLAGMGWDFGVPFIARQTDRGTPRYSEGAGWDPDGDRFVFNGGQELVPICIVGDATHGCSGRLLPSEQLPDFVGSGWRYFRAHVEGSFLRFFWAPDRATWLVQDKSGVTMELGAPLHALGDGSSDLETPALDRNPDAPSELFRWHLIRQYDTYVHREGSVRPNNPVRYVWHWDAADARVYLVDIYSTPGEDGSPLAPGFTWAHRTHLEYEVRSDPSVSYRAGWRMGQRVRLAGVTNTSHDFDSTTRRLVRALSLSYDASSHVSLLTAVRAFGRGGDGSEATARTEAELALPEFLAGRSDLGAARPLPPTTLEYTHVAGTTTLPGYEPMSKTVRRLGVQGGDAGPKYSVDEELTDLFDVNSDGLPDVLVTAPGLFSGDHGLYLAGKIAGADNPGQIGFEPARRMSVVPLGGVDSNILKLSNANVTPLDLSGDGRIDLVHMPQTKTYEVFTPRQVGGAWQWQGRSVATADGNDAKLDFTRDSQRTRVVDVDNDGLVDVVITTGTEVQTYFALGRYPGGDGRFGHATWTGPDTAALSAEPIRGCLPWSATPIQFDDPDVKFADMNADGLPDIVRLRSGDVRYWPGRGNGYWGTGDRHACLFAPYGSAPSGSFGDGRQVEMSASPNYSVVQGDGRLLLDDVNGDGLADLVEVRFLDVDVYLNVDGTGWTERAVLSGTPAAAPSTQRVRLVDVDGSGTRDLLWGDGYEYRYIDLQGGARPWLLRALRSGLGKRTEIEYQSSVREMLAHAGTPEAWTRTMPTVAQVVNRVTVTPEFQPFEQASGHEQHVTEFAYFDPVYEGRQREFRGFSRTVATRVGDDNSPTDLEESRYLLGECAEEPASTGAGNSCADDARWQDNPREALKGLPWLTETRDVEGTTLATSHTGYRLRTLYTGLDGRRVRHAFAQASTTYRYDTTDGTFGAGVASLSLPTVTREEGGTTTLDGTFSVPLRSTSRVKTESDNQVDFFGNRTHAVARGCTEGCRLGPDEVITTYTEPALLDEPTRWLWRTTRSYVTGSEHPGRLWNDTRVTYDAHGNPVASTAELDGSLPLDRAHGTSPARASADGTISLGTRAYDPDFGLLLQEVTPGGRCRTLQYDGSFRQLVVFESVSSEGPASAVPQCSGAQLATHAAYDRGFAAVTSVVDPAGQRSSVEYDEHGRVIGTIRPDPGGGPGAAASTRIEYFLPGDLPGLVDHAIVHTSTEDGRAPGDGDYLESWAYVDGLGRTRVALSESETSNRWILGPIEDFDAKGATRRKYLPRYLGGVAPPDLAFGGDTSVFPDGPYGRQRYDAFGRAIQTYDIDGTPTLTTRHHALSVDAYDAADLLSGPHQGTHATTESDGHGRTIRTTERVHAAGGGATVELRHVDTTYLPIGPAETVTRRRGAERIVRWLRYDSLGRLILNVEPNTTVGFTDDLSVSADSLKAWRYAYADNGDLVGTSDSRGCGANFFYDRAGRLVAEDYVPCQADQPAYTAPDLDTYSGVEVLYLFDEIPPSAPEWMIPTGGWSGGFARGRPIATFDRARASFVDYDARGRVVYAGSRLAAPTALGPEGSASAGDPGSAADAARSPELPVRYAPRVYRRQFAYDAADREIASTTGASVPELLGLELGEAVGNIQTTSRSAVTTAYTTRGTVASVGGSYRTLISGIERTGDGLVTRIEYGDVAHTATAFSFDERRRVASVQTYRGPPPQWSNGQVAPAPAPTGPPSSFQLLLQDEDYLYDVVGNPIEIRDWRPTEEWPAGAKPVQRKVQYDDLYRVARIDYQYAAGDDAWTDPFAHEAATGDSDLDPRLARPTPHVRFDRRALTETFEYDWLGNTTSTDDDAHGFYDRSLGDIDHDAARPYQLRHASNASRGGPRTGTVDARYDPAGNLTALSLTRQGECIGGACSQRFAYQWDEAGRLVRARRWDGAATAIGDADSALPSLAASAELRYTYDASDARVLKTAVDLDGDERHTAYIFGSLELRRTAWDDATGDFTLDALSEVPYLHAHGVRLARAAYEPAAKGVPTALGEGTLHVLFDLGDHLGSTSVVLDQATGELVERSTYLGYGSADSDYRPDRWKGFREDYRFTGKEEDVEVGLTYFGARYLSTGLGRWVSADPLTVHGLGADLNGYAYVSGGVLKNVDPLGLCGNDGAGGACPTAGSEQGPDTGAEGQGGRRDDYADGSGSGSSASVHFSPKLNTAYAEPERAIAVEAPRVTPQTPRHGTSVLAAGATAAGYATAMIEGQVPVGGAFAGVAGDLAVGTARLPDSVKLGWSLGRMYGGFQLLVQGGAEAVLGGAAEPVTAGASTPVFAHEVGVIPNGLASISGGFGVFMSVLSGSGSGGGGGTTAAGGAIAEARAARDAAGRLPDGRPDRSSAPYAGIARDGEVAVGRSGPGVHAEVAADGQLPGGTMTEVMGWRRNPSSGQLEWTEIPICPTCQTRFPAERFVPGTSRAPTGGSQPPTGGSQ